MKLYEENINSVFFTSTPRKRLQLKVSALWFKALSVVLIQISEVLFTSNQTASLETAAFMNSPGIGGRNASLTTVPRFSNIISANVVAFFSFGRLQTGTA